MFFSLKEIIAKLLGGREKEREPSEASRKAVTAPAAPEPKPDPAGPMREAASSPEPGGASPRLDRHGIRQLRRAENLYALFTGEVPEEVEPGSFAELFPGSLSKEGMAALLVAKHGLGLDSGEQPLGRQARLRRYPPPQVELDLHGLTVNEAAVRVESFVQTAQGKGLKTLRLITGKGLHSQGRPVLPGITESLLLALQARNVVYTYRWDGCGREPSGSVVVYLVN